jgi:hypothetical protein
VAALEWLGFAVGLGLVLATAISVLETTVVPRGSRSRLTAFVLRVVTLPMRIAASQMDDYEARDRFRAYASAGYVVSILLVWVVLFLAGFALMLWPWSTSLASAFRTAGSSMVTLGFAVPRGAVPLAIVYVAALTGLVVVALQIAYLPVLYAAYNRRETLVTMLEGLAGTPGWGPEILLRSAAVDNIEGLGSMYDRWMEWAADVSESHTAYQVLMYFRSPTARRSWVISLLSILDAAAMHLALCPVTVPAPARNLMRVGYLAFRQLSASIGHPVPADPSPDDAIELTRDDFILAAERVRAGGMEFEREPEDAWVHFKGWRVNYEEAAYALAASLDVVPALWSGTRPRPGPPVPPITPVDRVSPNAEVSEIQRVRALRRQRRIERQSHLHHDAPAGDGDSP